MPQAPKSVHAIRFTQGNLLEAPVEALVNAVNEKGIMGKGIALLFKEAFPESAKVYQEACRLREVRVGRMLVTERSGKDGPRFIIHFPTKKDWRDPSELHWIREGLKDLRRVIGEHRIRSIALPALGCGHGGLDWSLVREEIENVLGKIEDVDILVYEPATGEKTSPK
jgi:O-acetyl-ADP-ribose deacetylase (regulator of RNase III)